MKDPLVSIEFLNFKYTVLGAVGSNGTYTVDGDRVTLLEAIAKAGDLTSKAKVDRVAVIREIEGERQIFMHDLRTKDIFDSPCFYLQQNDIVYVEPKYKKKDVEDRGVAGCYNFVVCRNGRMLNLVGNQVRMILINSYKTICRRTILLTRMTKG